MNQSLLIKPEEFFRDKVSEAISNQKLLISQDVESYVVKLLVDFIDPTKLDPTKLDPNGTEVLGIDTPLALILKSAMEAPPSQRLKIFKNMGDVSLYLSGFFQDYFNRRVVDISYYISMGSAAYENVAMIIRNQYQDRQFAETFARLSERFHQLVEVVAEVSENQNTEKPLDILSVYDRWTRTHSERLRKSLCKIGIIPIETNMRERQ